MPLSTVLLLALLCRAHAVKPSLARGSIQGLKKALSASRAVVAELAHAPQQPAPASFALDDISARTREAGAAALVVPASFLSAIASEQARAISSYPGPLPLVCQLVPAYDDPADESDATVKLDASSIPLADLRSQGADGILLRVSCVSSSSDLAAIVSGAAAESLGTMVIATTAKEVEAALAAQVTAIICEGEARMPAEPEGAAASVVGFGLWWDGKGQSLDAVRTDGFERVFIEDACAGDVSLGAARCLALIAKARSKKSSQWSGSMFGVSENDPPERKNALAWAQSKRQAREIMHESAASRGLPPPQLRK
jgi:hypothetical protein